MTTGFFDVAINWFGSGANAPKICLPFDLPVTRSRHFGDPDGSGAHDSLVLTAPDGAWICAPMNGLLWQVPALGSGPAALPDDVLPGWPNLRRVDGGAFGPRSAFSQLAEFDLLLEVWPTAFRRLEYVLSSLEIPIGMDDWDMPQMPVPRWFWFRGLGALGSRAQDIANRQFQGTALQPDLTNFSSGRTPLYVAAGDLLTLCDSTTLEVRAFDACGSVIDPDFVFAMFEQMRTDSDFTGLFVNGQAPAQPAAPWNAPERHVIVVRAGGDKPFVSAADPDSVDPGLPLPAPPARELAISPSTLAPLSIPDHGVIVIDSANSAYAELTDKFVRLELQGEHQRLALRPHGILDNAPAASFGRQTFLRLEAVDFARWFPVSMNPRNRSAGLDDRFQRYTDGNEIIPLIDGRETFREIYRTWRATHVVETYDSPDHVPALDPAFVPGLPDPARQARAKILLTNAWIEPDATLLGRRALIAAPRTQPDPVGSLAQLLASFVVVGALSPRGEPDFPSTGPISEYRLWWLVSTTPLPPGAYVSIRQLTYIESVHGDDPRLPDVSVTSDIFGLTTTLSQADSTSAGFVSRAGRCVIPILLKTGEDPRAQLRVVTFTPDPSDPDPLGVATSGKGKKHIVGSDEILLPTPANPSTAPTFSAPDGTFAADELSLAIEFDGVPGRAIVVIRIAANTPVAATPVLVVVARTGEVASGTISSTGIDGAELRVTVEAFALQDLVLVGFPPAAAPDLSACSVFYVVKVKEDQMLSGTAMAHPTEVLGALQDAIRANVDTRLLVWHPTDRLLGDAVFATTGTAAALNSEVNGHRGQAMLDSLVRHEFGVHHQKSSFIQTARPTSEGYGAVAFVGGIDLQRNRWDTPRHDAIEPDRQSDPFHDIHCRIRGRAVWDVYRNLYQRWNAALRHPDLTGHDVGWSPLPGISDVSAFGNDPEETAELTLQTGYCTAQINRTLAPFVPEHSDFLDDELGDLSIQKSYWAAIAEARRFLFIQDQYFFNIDLATRIHEALKTHRIEFVILVLPRKFSDFTMGDLMTYAQRRRAISILLGTPGQPDDVTDRVIIVTPKNDLDQPVYVHCKVMVADDLWLSISSSNMSRRSMTYDGEIGVMAIDRRGARGGQHTARQFRVDLLAQLLGLTLEEQSLVEDPFDAFNLLKDYFAGRWPGRHFKLERSGLAEMDTAYTHYGIQPANVDGSFIDALNAIADPDGTRNQMLPAGLVEFRVIQEALGAATQDQPFGGLGRLEISFDVGALGDPSEIEVKLEIVDSAASSAILPLSLGPYSAEGTVNAGIVQVATIYKIVATAAFSTTPDQTIGSKQQLSRLPGEPGAFVTSVHIVF